MDLPAPDPAAMSRSRSLTARMRDEVVRDGWLSFARYMELALYEPGLGYYSSSGTKLGRGGDFVTAPEISDFFGRALASQIADVMALSAPVVIEVGAGSGRLAASILNELARRGCVPDRYGILELSADLRLLQRETLRTRCPQHIARVEWMDQLPQVVSGVVVANEVLDAMPVHWIEWREDRILERGVVIDASGAMGWQEREATGAVRRLAEIINAEPPYSSEISLAVPAWTREWGRRIACGALVLIDYGFPRREYYHHQRSRGTLMCHYRHRAHEDPLYLPGLCDITAHVDFTAVAEAASEAGLDVLGYTSQGSFLINCGIAELLAAEDAGDAVRYMPMAASVSKLLSPSEMGELFKVIVLGRGIEEPLRGFVRGDRTHTL